ncbi:hypothetical protein Ctaglu_36770 [Clostridium tagluense]|uniref:Uncharacterized protein n=1 Tax=Clostridium tagluense TaxID=360422 RepID=A0A401URA0_9CLOT|nr:hypothetical protein Ctaglu_36770 [Clostridium tagluense]
MGKILFVDILFPENISISINTITKQQNNILEGFSGIIPIGGIEFSNSF